ncbi:hypothetical protein BH09PSE4_BH09PSE4_13560 [soil metagenome]
MRFGSYLSSSDDESGSIRNRAVSILLTILVHLLIVLVLLRLAPVVMPPEQRAPTSFSMLPDPGAEAKPARKAAKQKHAGGAAAKAPKAVTPAPTAAPPAPPLAMLILDKQTFRAADVSKLPSHSNDQVASAANSGSGDADGATDGPGSGPGGERLYNADWYVRPTNAQLAFYTPKNTVGWGMVACKTIANYRVDQCRELGESPPGSGLARAVRQAAWQFRVVPPRIGGRAMVGTWVRINIDFTVIGASPRG